MKGRLYHKLFLLLTLGILLLGAVGLSACSQAAMTPPAKPTSEPFPPLTGATSPIMVNISGFAFSQANIRVPVGATVTWTNKDSVTHTIASDKNVFDSGNLAPGGTFSYTFKESGTFQYHCNPHPSMTGKIVVGE